MKKKPLYDYKEHILWNAKEHWPLSFEERKTIELEAREEYLTKAPEGCILRRCSCKGCGKNSFEAPVCDEQCKDIRRRWKEAEAAKKEANNASNIM